MKKTLIALMIAAGASSVFATADVQLEYTDITGAVYTNATIASGVLYPTNEEIEVTITPTNVAMTNSGFNVTVAMTANFADPAETTTNLTSDASAQGGIVLTSSGWQCWDTTAASTSGDWVAITNENVGTAAGTYNIVADLDYTAKTVSYSVNSNAMATTEGTAKFDLKGSPSVLNYLGLLGSGNVSSLEITYWTTNVTVTTDESGNNTITVNANTTADLKDLTASTEGTSYTVVQGSAAKTYNLVWSDVKSDDDTTTRYAKVVTENNVEKLVVKEGSPKNGMDSYSSYALGLDAESETSKPLLKSEQNDNPNALSFSVGNVAPKTEAANITCTLTEMTSPTDTTGTTTTFAADSKAEVALPTSGVKYYKLSIKVKAK